MILFSAWSCSISSSLSANFCLILSEFSLKLFSRFKTSSFFCFSIFFDNSPFSFKNLSLSSLKFILSSVSSFLNFSASFLCLIFCSMTLRVTSYSLDRLLNISKCLSRRLSICVIYLIKLLPYYHWMSFELRGHYIV